jgi:PAS domain S-box-containing protein
MYTILAVDDDAMYRRMIEKFLQKRGCRVVTAANGKEALAAARTNPPDLILSDILMPVMDGFTLCRHWQEDPELCNIPFVFFSATYTDPKDEKLGLNLGATMFVRKTSELKTIWQAVEQILKDDAAPASGACRLPVDDDHNNLQQYNERLIHKLEAKMVQLQETQEALQDEIAHGRQLEKALKASEKQFRAFVENSVDGVLVTDAETYRIVYANPAISCMLGYSQQQMAEMTVAQIYPVQELEAVQKQFEDLAKGRKSMAGTVPCRRKDGTIVYADIAAKPFELDGRYFVVGFFRDVTDRMKVEEERRRLAEVVAHSPNIVMIMDTQRRIQYVNPVFEQITGISTSEILGQTPGMLEDGMHDPSFFKQLWTTIRMGNQWTGRITNKRRDGRLYHLEADILPVKGADGRIKNFAAIMRDITHEENMAAQLRQAQKMEAIGTLAGGIAHDFNNILTALLGFSELGLMSCDKGSRIHEHFAAIYDAGQRAKDLVAQILTFSRMNEESHKPIYLYTIMNEALKLLRSTMPSTITFETHICKENIYVMADATAIHQIVMNLCTNAGHVMQENGGTLTVSLEKVDLTSKEIAAHPHIRPGPHLKLSISDTGHGMTRYVLDHIFEPYFTTKEKGEGTGLGLSVVHGIVQNHGGMIMVNSEPGKGSTFDVFFPVVAVKCKAVKPRNEQVSRGSERILFVDDEIPLVRLAQQMLTSMGYQVTSFTDSREALADFKTFPEKYDIVISDMTMPHLTGLDLARYMLAMRPGLPFILCTGYSSKLNQQQIEEAGIKSVLKKPFSLATISKQIRAIFDPDADPLDGSKLQACGN